MWIPKAAAFIRGRRLFETRGLFEDILYPLNTVSVFFHGAITELITIKSGHLLFSKSNYCFPSEIFFQSWIAFQII